jgi:hypothetical protein
MESGIKAIYHPYCNSAEKGYSFGIELEPNVFINADGFTSQEDRDKTAYRICEQLGLILVY